MTKRNTVSVIPLDWMSIPWYSVLVQREILTARITAMSYGMAGTKIQRLNGKKRNDILLTGAEYFAELVKQRMSK